MATWIIIVEWLARLILLGLIGLSVWSVSIMIERRRFLKNLEKADEEPNLNAWIEGQNREALTSWSQNQSGLRAGTVRAMLPYLSGQSSDVGKNEKRVRAFWTDQRKELEKGLGILGTLGSTTPFIGLLGTILGIIVAFGALSTGQIDSMKVMYALAEALILTAVGLGVAIPAVVAFNYFNRRLSILLRECEALRDRLIAGFGKD